MNNHLKATAKTLKALSNENRLQILLWLKDPESHFPPQRDGDLIVDGVCLGAIVDKLGVSQPTTTAYMRTLADNDLVIATRIKQWTFYRLNHHTLANFQSILSDLIINEA